MSRPKIKPVVWQPPGVSAPGPREELPSLKLLEVNGAGPEDVLVDEHGHVYTGLEDGRVLRVTEDGRRIDIIADTGGRPLGLEFYPDGQLLVCDAEKGLLLVDRATGKINVLVPRGVESLRVCNNAAVSFDGTVYFSDSSQRFDLKYWRADLFEHSSTGRLLRRTPDGKIDVLLGGLGFANGVALAADESFVAVAQTSCYQVDRVWLDGSRQPDTLVKELPAFPDNISTGSDGLIWIAMASPRNRLLDRVSPMAPVLRRIVWALPEALQPQPQKVAWVRAVDADGQIVHDLGGPSEEFYVATGVRERDGKVYFGSLESRSVAIAEIRPQPPR